MASLVRAAPIRGLARDRSSYATPFCLDHAVFKRRWDMWVGEVERVRKNHRKKKNIARAVRVAWLVIATHKCVSTGTSLTHSCVSVVCLYLRSSRQSRLVGASEVLQKFAFLQKDAMRCSSNFGGRISRSQNAMQRVFASATGFCNDMLNSFPCLS